METRNIMIVGVGGQGSLLASKLLGHLLMEQGYDVKVSEVHGMSQRGGSVVTYVRYGDKVSSPVIDKGEADYIVRRLTPTECARLQGFPDWWCDGLGTENPTEEEMIFWREVFETHRKIMGTSGRPKSDSQIRKWLKDPHSDSAEYRMWGNGCALPNVYFVLCGIVYYAQFPDYLL